MPKIPTYDQLQVEARPLSGVRHESIASPGLLDAGAEQQIQTGRSLIGAGNELAHAAVQMQERRNAEQIFEKENALNTDYVGFYKASLERRGANAEGLTKDAAKWWDDNIKAHSDNLENDVQRRLFNLQVSKQRTSSLHSFASHEFEQTFVATNEAGNASIKSLTDAAAATAAAAPIDEPQTATVADTEPQIGKDADGNPMAVAPEVSVTPKQSFDVTPFKKDILNRVDVLAGLNGWKKEKRDQVAEEKLTQFHEQVIQNRVDKDPDGARAYFDENKSEIAGTHHDTIEKVLKVGGIKKVAQTFADEVQASGLTEANAIVAARQKFEGEQEDAAVQEIKTRFREQVEAKELMQRKANDTAWDIFAKTKRLSAVPASVLNDMDGKVRIALEKEAKDLVNGTEVKTDSNHYYDLRKMMRDDPAGFAKRDLRQDFPYLSRADREEFIKLQTTPSAREDALTLQQQLQSTYRDLGWHGTGDDPKKGLLEKVVGTAIFEEQKRLGKKLDQAERQKIIDRMIMEGEVLSGHWYTNDPNKRMFEVYGTEDQARFAPKVPKDDRTKIEAALKRAGRPVTDAEVIRLYKLKNGMP